MVFFRFWECLLKVFLVCKKNADQEQKRPKLFPVCQKFADQEHPPLLRGRPGLPTSLPRRSNGQGPRHRIRPCPSEGGLFTHSPYHNLSNLISSIDLEQKRAKMQQVVGTKGLGDREGCGRWATLPVEAGPGFQPDCSVRGPSPNIPLYGAGCGEQHPRAPQRERRRPVRRTKAESRGVR